MERKLFSVGLGATILFAIAAFTIVPKLTSAPPSGPVVGSFQIEHHGPMPDSWLASTRDSKCWDPKPAERGFARSTNELRRQAGRTNLQLDAELSQAARKHTREMTSQNLLHHTSTESLKKRVTFWSLLGENVGVGNTVDSLQNAFMDSPGHRENILYTTFRHVGIGTRSAYGRLWVTVLFEARDDPGTTLRMPRC
jgi:uncharacterized protein YkwD